MAESGFTGISFPFRIGVKGGVVMSTTSVSDVQHIIEAMTQILGTRPMERCMEYHFKSDLDSDIFEPNDASCRTLIAYQAEEALKELEDRINALISSTIGESALPAFIEYTDKPLKGTLAVFKARNREEAIEKYSTYFDSQYGRNREFTAAIDEIYEIYKTGEDVYLECYCGVGDGIKKNCHGEVIVEKLQKRLLREKIKEYKNKKNEMG